MVDDFTETFQSNAAFANITIEEADTNDDVWQLAQLRYFFRGGEGNEWSQTGSRQHWFQSGGDFSFNSIWDGVGQLDLWIISNDVLLVLVQQVVKNFLVEQGDAFKVISRPGLKADDLINQAVWLVGEIGDVLLAWNFLLDVGRVIADLKFDSV